jgi:hypothetical protein
LNPDANTGYIKKIKHAAERYDLQLSDALKNVKNGDKGCTGSDLNLCNLTLLSMILQLE